MIKYPSLSFLAFSLAAMAYSSAADSRVEGTAFVLDGKPFQIRSGEIHYPRVSAGRRTGARRGEAPGGSVARRLAARHLWQSHQRRGDFPENPARQAPAGPASRDHGTD